MAHTESSTFFQENNSQEFANILVKLSLAGSSPGNVISRRPCSLPLLVTTILVALTVLIHFEALRWLSAFMLSPHSRFRLALLVCMLGAMVAHVIEISVFGLEYYYFNRVASIGLAGRWLYPYPG